MNKGKFKRFNYDFNFKLNGDIICKRNFDIRGFDVARSDHDKFSDMYLIRDMLDEIMGSNGLITNYLKTKTIKEMWQTYNPFVKQELEDIPERTDFETDNYFDFEITYKNRPIIQERINGDYYSRTSIDIKDITKEIRTIVDDYLGNRKSYNINYN